MAIPSTKLPGKALIQALCDLEIPDTIKLSPNTQQVLYSTQLAWGHRKSKDRPAVSTLWLAETGKSKSARQITSGDFKDYSPRWSPDGNSIAFISDRAKPGEKWAIYLWNLQNGIVAGEPYAITDKDNERSISKFDFSPDGTTIAYVSADEKTKDQKAQEEDGEDFQIWNEDWPYGRLRVVDIASKQVRCVTDASISRDLPDRHVFDFAWASDSQQIAIATAKTPHLESPFGDGSEIAILDIPNAKVDSVCSYPASLLDLTWTPEGGLYWRGGIPANKSCGGQSICGVNYAAADNYESIAFGIADDCARFSLVGDQIIAKVHHGLQDRLCTRPNNVIFEASQHIDAFGAGRMESNELVLAIATSNVNTPVEVYTTKDSGKTMRQVSNHGAVFQYHHFGSCHFLHHRSKDNEVDLDSIFLTPSQTLPTKPQPTVVLIHGGPTDRNTNRFDAYYHYWAPWLLSHGYSIILPNYRGSLGKGETFASYSYRGVGSWDYEDVVTITNHAMESGFADKERLIVGGISQGGYLSYLSSVRNGSLYPWKFEAAIPLNGVTDWDALALTSDLGATLEVELNGGIAPWNVAKSDTSGRQGSAIYEFHDAVQKSKSTGEMIIPPMLILHGEKDERCPITQAWGMRRALTAAGLPFEMVTYLRQPHIATEQKVWIDMAERVLAWCEKHIGPGERES